MTHNLTIVLLFAALLFVCVKAEWPDGSYGDSGRPSWWNSGDNGDDDDDGNNSAGNGSGSGSGSLSQGAVFSSEASFNKANRILIAHGVLASLVWVLFVPSLAILLRVNMKNPIVLKLHAIGQILSYVIFIVAAGMGIWLAQQSAAYGIWDDVHPRLGLAILAIAFFQPIFGFVHHRIYKKRASNLDAGKLTKAPGRTLAGRAHLWVGRVLIALGIINGGMGIRLASYSPFQTEETSRKAKIAYGVVAGVMFTLYLVSIVTFEVRRARFQNAELDEKELSSVPKSALPTYDESEESVGRARYQ